MCTRLPATRQRWSVYSSTCDVRRHICIWLGLNCCCFSFPPQLDQVHCDNANMRQRIAMQNEELLHMAMRESDALFAVKELQERLSQEAAARRAAEDRVEWLRARPGGTTPPWAQLHG